MRWRFSLGASVTFNSGMLFNVSVLIVCYCHEFGLPVCLFTRLIYFLWPNMDRQVPISDAEATLCQRCRPKEAEIYMQKVAKVAEVEESFSRLWTECQRCQVVVVVMLVVEE